jgi:hypothetical protein
MCLFLAALLFVFVFGVAAALVGLLALALLVISPYLVT